MWAGHFENAAIQSTESGRPALATPADRRAMILGYLTYRGDARVKRQVTTLICAGYAVDVICLAEDIGGNTGGANLIGITVPHYRGYNRLRYILAYATFFLKAAWTAARLAASHHY